MGKKRMGKPEKKEGSEIQKESGLNKKETYRKRAHLSFSPIINFLSVSFLKKC